jgi:hypothetical protein
MGPMNDFVGESTMNKSIKLISMAGLIIIGIGILFINYHTNHMFIATSSQKQSMFPKWNGYDISYGQYGAEDIVCIVQYTYSPDIGEYRTKLEDTRRLRKEWAGEVANGGDYPLLRYVPVKGYADKEIIKRIIGKLHAPEQRGEWNTNIETDDYLLLVGISRKLESQFIFRVPFKLTEDGYAITPRGKDKELYELLNSGLKEWEVQRIAEKERSDAIYNLYKKARDSDNVDYNTLYVELKKLDALFGAKDPNDLRQIIKEQKEGLRQMRGTIDPNQSNHGYGL